jgi:hypothetical protein
MGDTLHFPGAPPLMNNLLHIAQTDAKALRQPRLRSLALLVGLQNPAPQIVGKRSCHPVSSGDLAAFNLPSLLSLHYLLIWSNFPRGNFQCREKELPVGFALGMGHNP